MSSVGLTKLVYAILSQNGHGSHYLMPSVSQVRRLITVTPDPPSIIFMVLNFP